ncbi:MAG TPA: MFS transporter [Acidimicrobiales bacterium]|nr:MFS transporter [Acidimicrobiales bacterium]
MVQEVGSPASGAPLGETGSPSPEAQAHDVAQPLLSQPRPAKTEDLQGPGKRRLRLVVLGICSLSLFMATLDNTIVNVALPVMQRQFHASVAELQWVADAYLLVLASLLVFAGSLGDRFGRRRVLRTGLVIFGLGSLACSLSVNLPMLIACRMLQACGGCMLNPNSLSIISDTFRDRRERAAAIGFWGGVVGVSTAAGPILGGGLIEVIDWRAIFWVNVPVVLAAIVLIWRFVPESRAAKPRRFDPRGQVLAVVVLACLTYGIIEGPGDGWTSAPIVTCFAVVLGGLVALVIAELRQPEPLVDLRFFKSPPFSGAAAIATLAFVVLAGWLFLNTLYLQEVRHYSPLLAGTAALPATLVIVVVSPLTGRAVGTRGPRVPLIASGFLLAAGSGLLILVDPSTPYWFLACCYLLIGLGFGMVNPPITNTAMSGMPLAQAGVAAAIASTSRQVGSVLGVAVLGSLVSAGMKGQVESRLAKVHLPAKVAAQLKSSSAGAGGLASTNLPPRAAKLAGEAFAAATHAGWVAAAACGLAVALVATATTGRRAVVRAKHVMAQAG